MLYIHKRTRYFSNRYHIGSVAFKVNMESTDESDYPSSSNSSDEPSSFLPSNCNFQWIYTEATTGKNGVRTETSYQFVRDLKQNNLPMPSFNQSATPSLSR